MGGWPGSGTDGAAVTGGEGGASKSAAFCPAVSVSGGTVADAFSGVPGGCEAIVSGDGGGAGISGAGGGADASDAG